MTLTQLRAFLAAYELGSFTAAAKMLETSQASVSELISRLEHELEHSLFTRGGRRLLPTTAAVELQMHARQSVASFDSGIEALKSISSLEGGVCTFGVLRYGAYYDLADLVQRFHRRYPKVKVRLVGLNSVAVAESVASGEIEAGLIVLPVVETGLHVRPLFRDQVFYVSATRDPSRARSPSKNSPSQSWCSTTPLRAGGILPAGSSSSAPGSKASRSIPSLKSSTSTLPSVW
jgi:DNA-binding transcriptional LysR family regulator